MSNVSAILDRRLAGPMPAALRRAIWFASTIHVLALLAAIFLPALLAPPPKPLEFVAIQIVPAARLGVEEPKPAPPKPEPKKPEPVEEPKPESKAPVLPDPKQPPKKEPPKKEASRTPDQVSPSAPANALPQVKGSALGVAHGISATAPAAKLDAPDFTYGYYVDQMLAQISRNWTRPPVGSGVEAEIEYRIERNGRIVDVRIARSSGINSFDLAALRAVQSASPLAPLPAAFKKSSLGVNLIVR